MAAKIDLPLRVFGHGWILSDEKKMSKSLGNILDPLDIIKKYGIDQLRYYLIKEVSLGNDGNISLENLKNCINNDLANNYGNLCQRVLSFIKKNSNNCIPKPNELEKVDISLLNNLKNEIPNLKNLINDQELNIYLKKIIDFSFDSNKYFNDSEPWKLKKIDPKRMNTILFVISEQIKNISILLSPIIPIATKKILDNLNILPKDRFIDSINQTNIFDHEKPLKDSEILFSKIEDDN